MASKILLRAYVCGDRLIKAEYEGGWYSVYDPEGESFEKPPVEVLNLLRCGPTGDALTAAYAAATAPLPSFED